MNGHRMTDLKRDATGTGSNDRNRKQRPEPPQGDPRIRGAQNALSHFSLKMADDNKPKRRHLAAKMIAFVNAENDIMLHDERLIAMKADMSTFDFTHSQATLMDGWVDQDGNLLRDLVCNTWALCPWMAGRKNGFLRMERKDEVFFKDERFPNERTSATDSAVLDLAENTFRVIYSTNGLAFAVLAKYAHDVFEIKSQHQDVLSVDGTVVALGRMEFLIHIDKPKKKKGVVVISDEDGQFSLLTRFDIYGEGSREYSEFMDVRYWMDLVQKNNLTIAEMYTRVKRAYDRVSTSIE